MTLSEIKTLVDKNKKIKSKDAAILLIYAIENNLNPAIVMITEQDVQRLSRAGVILLDASGNPKINYKLLKDKDEEKEAKEIYDYVKENIETYRDLWAGLFVGSKGGPGACVDKLTRWLINNKEYSFEDVLKAAKYWIDNKSREVDNPMLIGQADYFIYKKEGKTEKSRLSSIIEDATSQKSEQDFHTLI